VAQGKTAEPKHEAFDTIFALGQPSSVGGESPPLDPGFHIKSGSAEPNRPPSDRAEDGVHLARCFLRLANLPNFALDRLSRYEAMLSRQVAQTLFALDGQRRRD
jgi:hypothetical protein